MAQAALSSNGAAAASSSYAKRHPLDLGRVRIISLITVLISTELSCALRTLMHETGYSVRATGTEVALISWCLDPATEFDRMAQAYFGLSPRRSGFGRCARSP